jgi:cytochrome P450
MSGVRIPSALPGPRPVFLLGWRGNMLRFARDPIGYTTRLHRAYGNIAALVRGGNRPLNSPVTQCPGTVFAFGPRYNQQLLSDPAQFHSNLLLGLEQTAFARLGSGLLNMNDDKHKQQRRMILPAFQKKRIESYVPDMIALARQTLESWSPGTRRDIAQDMRQLTLRIAGQALLGARPRRRRCPLDADSCPRRGRHPPDGRRADRPGQPPLPRRA